MTWVKICGLRTPEDVATAVDAGADAVGFVVARSPRQVTPEQAASLAKDVGALTVLVTLGIDAEEALQLLTVTGVDALQPHGSHQRDAAVRALDAGYRVLFPTQVEESIHWTGIPDGALAMVDAPVPGSGQPFDWGLLADTDRDFVLAGGLTPDNVAEAITATGAWGVDVSSGVESAPGRKDPALVRSFVQAAKSP